MAERTESQEPSCRLCLAGHRDVNDPLIRPCQCTGTVSDIHIRCLRSWIQSKLKVKHGKNVLSVLWENLECEVCKASITTNVNCTEEELVFMNFQRTIEDPYIVVKACAKVGEHNGIFVLGLHAKKNFNIVIIIS